MKNPDLRILRYEIPKSLDGIRVGAFLREKGYSRHILSHLKRTNLPDCCGITRNGEHIFTTHRLSGGDLLEVRLLETDESEYVPESPLPIDMIYEDEDIQLIHKPAGLPVHPSKGHFGDSLGNALCYYAHHSLGKEKFIYRVINRLDRDTSGLLICAKNMLAAGVLGAALTAREIRREYLAICCGNPMEALERGLPAVSAAPFPSLSEVHDAAKSTAPGLRISAPLLDQGDVAMKRCVDFERGIRAVSFLQLLEYDSARDLSLIRLRLETGRTHQIRVHMLYLGHPLPGDFLYHPNFRYISRQALHSHALRFRHPINGQTLCFEAPLPADMRNLFPHYREHHVVPAARMV